MTADLERLVQAAEGQAPSDDFVAGLRARIVAETEGAGAGVDQDGVRTADPATSSVIVAADETIDDNSVVFDLEPLQDDERTAGRG